MRGRADAGVAGSLAGGEPRRGSARSELVGLAGPSVSSPAKS